jgi:PKD domain
MKFLATLIGILFFSPASFAQMHDMHTLIGYLGGWQTPLGDKFGITQLTFSNGSLLMTENTQLSMNFDVTNASFSDSVGNLKAYSNGIEIGNKSWQVMDNGDYITTDQTENEIWPQFVLMLPKPEHKDRIIVIHGDQENIWPFDPITGPLWVTSRNLYWAEIDMSFNNGHGKVIARDKLIIPDTLDLGRITATKHANGRDWWILVREFSTNRFYTLLLDPIGLQNLGTQSIGDTLEINGGGQACFSPDGSKYMFSNHINWDSAGPGVLIHFYDFDRCTGLLSNARLDNIVPGNWTGSAISRNSKYAYLNVGRKAYQYDLTQPDVQNTRKEIANWDGYMSPFPTIFWYLQLMPDGRIYSSTATGSDVLHVIDQPDQPYPMCDYQQGAIKLPTYNAFSVPNFPYFRLGPIDGSSCDTLGINNVPLSWYRYSQDTMSVLQVQFHELAAYEPTTWHWDFGDGNTSNLLNPLHVFGAPGVYEVCLTVSNANGSDVHCKTLYLGVSAQENPILQDQIVVAPNPFKDRFSVALSAVIRQPSFRMYDVTGKLLLNQSLSFGINGFDTAHLLAGTYFWEVRSVSEVLKTGKLVKVE